MPAQGLERCAAEAPVKLVLFLLRIRRLLIRRSCLGSFPDHHLRSGCATALIFTACPRLSACCTRPVKPDPTCAALFAMAASSTARSNLFGRTSIVTPFL